MSEEELPLLQQLTPWLNCFCVVDFDLEYGQKLQYTVPPYHFQPEEQSNICFLSFPDSNTEKETDSVFVFRAKMTETRDNEESEISYSKLHPHIESSFFYGFAFFRQKKDSSISRGYLQKSVVLITRHPFIGLFKKLMHLVGPMFFQYGEALLESTFQNVCNWPAPKVGHTYDLPVLGSVLTYHVSHSLFPYLIDSRDGPPPVMSTDDELISNIQSVNVFYSFRKFVNKLWILWELVLVGEPILLLSPSPAMSSEAILGLVSIISPLMYSGDFRPFFTIHDTDFNRYSDENTDLPAVLLGATNPFFVKALQHWPHIMTLGFPLKKSSGSQGINNFKDELRTSYKAATSPDLSVLKQLIPLEKASNLKATVYKNNEILRRHFAAKTDKFLSPLESYFNLNLMPREKDVNPIHPPKLRSFNEEEFIHCIEKKSSVLTDKPMKKKHVLLYRRFFRSENFTVWYKQHSDTAILLLKDLYLKRVTECDVIEVIKDVQTVQVIDFFMRIRELAESLKGEDDIHYQMLVKQQEKILSSAPELSDALKDFII